MIVKMNNMTEKQNYIQNNRLIAEFMGVKLGVDQYSWRPGVYDPLEEKHLDYHKTWGWLMPVVDKIEEDLPGGFTKIHGEYWISGGISTSDVKIFTCEIHTDTRPDSFSIKTKSEESRMDAVYRAVVEFVKWKKNKKTKQQ